ncbi:MAG: DinB family protein [Vicinamibacterales bacterium]
MYRPALLLTAMWLTANVALAQEGVPTATLSASSKALYHYAQDYVIRAAEKMPEEHYAFRPTPDVRTFGQIVGHLADAQYLLCAGAYGEKPPVGGIEKGSTTKADLVKALKTAVDYCQRAHDVVAGPKGIDMIDGIPGGKHPRVGALYFNSMHTFEHYGNLITYLRLKGIVPPSSEPRKTAPEQ